MEQQETASIRFYTAGCMEFENFSECYEDLTLAQAVDIYKKIRKRNAPVCIHRDRRRLSDA